MGPEAPMVSLRERKPKSHLDLKTQKEASAGVGSRSFRVIPCLRATPFPFESEEEVGLLLSPLVLEPMSMTLTCLSLALGYLSQHRGAVVGHEWG